MAERTFSDQMGDPVSILFPPQRIISLVPSQTELLADLGLVQEVVGITKYCTHPHEWRTSKQQVGGTKDFNPDTITRLAPDLIIGNKEENDKEGIEYLKTRFPVWMSDITTFDDALNMITCVGQITGRTGQAQIITQRIISSFSGIVNVAPKNVLYLIWRKPWMASGRNTFIDTMLTRIGLSNAILSDRYPVLNTEDIRSLKAEYIFLSSEPYPFREKHIAELAEISPASTIRLVDGEMFSWYGSRLAKAPEYFRSLNLD